MNRTDYQSHDIRFWACIVLLTGLCGCTYQAKLLDHQQLEPGAFVAIQCDVCTEPIIKVSESGDFIFWAGGPGPLTWTIAKVINEANNKQYRKMLKPALDNDYFCENFQDALKQVVEEIGLEVGQISLKDKTPGTTQWPNTKAENPDHKYALQLKISCGLFKSEARGTARIEGRLLRLEDNKVIWKNKLCFEGQAAAEHKAFGDGKEAVRQWEKDSVALRGCLLEAVAGAIDLLHRELTTPAAEQQQLTKLKLKDGSRIKGTIIDKSQYRLIVRLEGGSLRSILAEDVVATKP